jgi:hypothetical protein
MPDGRIGSPFRYESAFTLRHSVLEYGGTLGYSQFAKTFVTFLHNLFRKMERAGNLRPILIRIILAFEYCEQE